MTMSSTAIVLINTGDSEAYTLFSTTVEPPYQLIKRELTFEEIKNPLYTEVPVIDLKHLPEYLLSTIHIIDSVNAGSHNPDIYENILQPILESLRLNHTYIQTTAVTSIANYAKDLKVVPTTIVLLSGDTSIHEFINSLRSNKTDKTKLFLSVIPTGTGNALASSLGYPNPVTAIKAFFRGNNNPLNIPKVEFSSGSYDLGTKSSITDLRWIVVVSWGFHAALVADSSSSEYSKLGTQKFKIAAEKNLSRDQIYKGTVDFKGSQITSLTEPPKTDQLNDVHLPGPHSYLLITNVSNLEEKFIISPKSKPANNGKLHLVEFGFVNGEKIMEIMNQVYLQGKHIENPEVGYFELKKPDRSSPTLVIQANEEEEQNRRWCVDGRIVVLGGDQKVIIRHSDNIVNRWELQIIG